MAHDLTTAKKKRALGLRPDFERAESYIPIYINYAVLLTYCCNSICNSIYIYKHFISLLCRVHRWQFTDKDWCNGIPFTVALKPLIL